MNPAEVKGMALLVVQKLQVERTKGITTPTHPVTGPDIVRAYNLKFGAGVREKDFWEIVHFIRAELKLPLGSNEMGYYWCINQVEWNETAGRLRERMKNQQRAIDGPSLAFAKSAQMSILEGAVGADFGAVKI